jgi:hypothetical protein
MVWCLSCHRNPENFVRDNQDPRQNIFNLYRKIQRHETLSAEDYSLSLGHEYQRSPEELEKGRQVLAKYHVKKTQLTDCWICHR